MWFWGHPGPKTKVWAAPGGRETFQKGGGLFDVGFGAALAPKATYKKVVFSMSFSGLLLTWSTDEQNAYVAVSAEKINLTLAVRILARTVGARSHHCVDGRAHELPLLNDGGPLALGVLKLVAQNLIQYFLNLPLHRKALCRIG